jgi:hypothetical protein
MPRFYSAVVDDIATTTAVDLFVLTAGAGSAVQIVEVVIGQSLDAGDTEAEMLEVELVRYASATGGTAATEVPFQLGDTSDSAVTTSDTTLGTTPTILRAETFNVQAGYQYLPVPEARIEVPPSGIFAVVLPAAAVDSLTIRATLTWAEIG